MQEKESKYPVFKAFSTPIVILLDHFKEFAALCGIVALGLSLIAFIFGQSFICMLPDVRGDFYCGTSVFLYVIYVLLKFLIMAVFLRVWSDKIFLNQNINLVYFQKNVTRFFKFFGVFLVFLLINSLPAFSLYFMILRIPNPICQIEIMYFLFMSLGFVIPFVLLRFYRNIALFVLDEPYFDLKQTYLKTNFKSSRIFFAFSIILALSLFFFLTINTNLKIHVFHPLGVYDVVAEYIFEVAVLIVATVIFNFIMTQKEVLE